jgi:hypothetical protein
LGIIICQNLLEQLNKFISAQAIALSKCCCVHDVPIHLRGAEEAMKRERNENAEMVTLQEPAQYSQQMANKGCSLQTIQRSNSRIY